MTVSVDLGSGGAPKNPFNADEVWGVDIYDTGNDRVKICDLAEEKYPFEDSSVDYVVATDFWEHIPRVGYRARHSAAGVEYIERYNPFLFGLSETWRILKPGGLTQFKTPAFPRAEAFQDPTHVNFITDQTKEYFAGGMLGLGHAYGFVGEFEEAWPQRWEGFWLVWEWRAVK